MNTAERLQHFKDREAAIAAFDRLWERDTPWILSLTGFSGHGKSTLLDWLEANRCRPHNLPYALISLGEIARADLEFALKVFTALELPYAAWVQEKLAALDS